MATQARRPLLERDIEARVCTYAKNKGLLHYKFTSPARIGVPDRMFVRKDGKIFFVEFKREGKEPTEVQLREHRLMRDFNVPVFVIDNVDDGRLLVDMMTMGVT